MGCATYQGTVTSGWLLMSTCGGSSRASSRLKSKSASGGACAGFSAALLLLVFLLPNDRKPLVPLQLPACCAAAVAAADGNSFVSDGPSARPPAMPLLAPARSSLACPSLSACLSGKFLHRLYTANAVALQICNLLCRLASGIYPDCHSTQVNLQLLPAQPARCRTDTHHRLLQQLDRYGIDAIP